jgi:DNA (cytosine-5)-methyltransferase 1
MFRIAPGEVCRRREPAGRPPGGALPDFYEFFAGGGMARAGLGPAWACLFANDFDPKKCRVYRENWGDAELKTADVRTLATTDIPGRASLAWASFPCQDLSLAGAGIGLRGNRSGAFWPFWKLVEELVEEGRGPELVALENVCGTLNSHDGKDFATICAAFNRLKYSVGALVIDASFFVPQSRPRLFIIGVREGIRLPGNLTGNSPTLPWHTRTLTTAYEKLPPNAKNRWIWWRLPLPPALRTSLADILEESPEEARWYSPAETRNLLNMMSSLNRAKLERARLEKRQIVGALYRRTRKDNFGRKVQRAEIRFDISGCLRTPAGGSSRQVVLVVQGETLRARLISSRETARLMGLPDTYKLPARYNDAYHITGDGVVVPVVRHLARCLFEPILNFGSLSADACGAAATGAV